MDRITKRIDGRLVFPPDLVGVMMTPSNDTMFRILTRLAAYEDTGLEPEEIKELCTDDVADVAKMFRKMIESGEINHLQDLIQAEQDGRLVVLDEKVALSMCAGARAIENNKRLFGVTYSYDIFGVHGRTKEISYFEAAKKLREIAELFLTCEEAEAALSGGNHGKENP